VTNDVRQVSIALVNTEGVITLSPAVVSKGHVSPATGLQATVTSASRAADPKKNMHERNTCMA
jgi:hypothetical protein